MKKLTSLIIVGLILLINFTFIISVVDAKDNGNEIDGTHTKEYFISGTCGWLQSYNPVYSIALAGTGGFNTITTSSWVGQQHSSIANDYGITRTYIQFDTSEIPTSATINNVVFHGDLLSVINDNSLGFSIHLNELTTGYTIPLGSNDWNLGSTYSSLIHNSPAYSLGGFSRIATTSFVNKGGISYGVLVSTAEGTTPATDVQNFFNYDLSEFSISVEATMTDPTADAGSDQTGNKGNYNFNGAGSSDGLMPITEWQWTFWYNSVQQIIFGETPSAFNFQILGSYSVTLRVEDDFGNWDTDVMIINIINDLPVANAGTNQAGDKGTYNFNGGGSSDSDGWITDYDWSFFYDGSTEYLTGVTPNFNFQIGGIYTVTLVVTDDETGTDSDTLVITINNYLPVADAGIDQSGFKTIYNFDGSNSNDPDGAITNYTWEFTDDGTKYMYGATPSYDFINSGVFTVTLTVIGDEGEIDTDTVDITIINRLPYADAGADQIGNRHVYNFDGSNSNDPDGAITNYTWSFNDGGIQYMYEATPSYDFQNLGVFTITLTVTGDEGDTDIDTVVVTINKDYSPIRIDSDADFTIPTNGVTSGTGTIGDPYIIEDWVIDATGYGCGIYIGNTTAHFEIRDCVIYDASGFTSTQYYYNSGIYLQNTDNGLIYNNIITGNKHGIYLFSSSFNNIIDNDISGYLNGIVMLESSSNNNIIVNNIISNTERGIYILTSNYNNIIGNNISGNGDCGIILISSNHNNIIDNSVIGNNVYGIWLYNTYNNNITNNNISENIGVGLYLQDSPNNNITNNNISENTNYGIYLQTSLNNYIYHNNFMGNTIHAYDDSINYWNSTYQFGGNYYNDYTGVDNYHGINQDILGSDGIGDVSYVFTGGQDYYPLMHPFETNNTPIADVGIDLWYQKVHHINGMNSSDAGGTSLNYTWTFTYNSISYTFWGVSFDFDFVIMGNYTVTLTLKDNAFNTDVDTLVVHVVPFIANAGLDDIAYRQIPYQFDGTGSRGDISIYRWTFNDGGLQTLNTVNPFYTFTTIGVYNVTLNLTETNGLYDDEDWVWVIVLNAPPEADAGINQAGARGIYIFDGSNSNDVDGTIVNYTWTFNDIVPQTLYEVNPSYNFTNTGIFTIMLKVTDNDGGIGFDNITVIIINQLPIANAGINQAGQKGTYIISGNASYDPDGTITNYEWTFVYNSTTYYFYNSWFDFYFYQYGDYEITLKVTDNDLDFVEDTTWVNITWLNPIADAGTDIFGKEVIDFDGTGCYDDDGSIVNYIWSFTYDSSLEEIYGETPNFNFNISGVYVVTLVIEDNDGLIATDDVSVTITFPSPIAEINIYPISTNKGIFTLDGSNSYDPDGIIIEHKWTIVYNGGVPFDIYGLTQPLDCTLEGTYDITLTVTDDDWRIGVDTRAINIIFKNPVAQAEIYVNDTLKGIKYFDATDSSDEDGTISTYDWMFTYNSVVMHRYGDNASFDFQLAGMYNVTLTITDDDGKMDIKEFSFWIIYQPPVADAGEDVMYMTDNNATFLNITLNGSASYDVDGSIVNYTWSYIYYNGTYYLYGENPVLMANINDSFAYNITLVVTDDNNLTGNTTVLIHVMSPIDVVQYFVYWLIILTITLFAIKIILRAVKKAKDPLDTQASGKKFSVRGKKI